MLEKIITSKARVAILELFFLNPGTGYRLREVARLLGLNANQVRRELDNLLGAGALARVETGNVTRYALDREFVFYEEFYSIIRKSAGIERMLAKALKNTSGITAAFIFGSYAEGRMTPKSDIDVMIIGEPNMTELNKTVNTLEKKIKRPIQYMVYPRGEFKKKEGQGFVKNVMGKKKIFIMGDANELGRTQKIRADTGNPG